MPPFVATLCSPILVRPMQRSARINPLHQMPTKPIRDGFHAITPYLFAEGASRLIEFISAAFEGELISH
jgi:hypothetical protein